MKDKDEPRLLVTVKDLRLSRRALLRGLAIDGAGDDDSAVEPTTTVGGEK